MRALIPFALLALAACEPEPLPQAPPGVIEAEGHPVLTMSGQTITDDMIEAVTYRFPPDQLEMMKQDEARWREFVQMVGLGAVLWQKALDEGLHEDPEIQRRLAMAQREILASQMLERIAEAAVSDEAMQAWYEEHQVQFSRPSIKVRHLVVQDEEQAKGLVERLGAGEDFAALAHEASNGRDARGGDLGWVERGRMVPAIEGPLFEAEVGEVVGPLQSRHGWHVALVEDKRDRTPLEDVRPQVEQRLKGEAVNSYRDEIIEEAELQWHEPPAAAAPEAGDEAEASAEPEEAVADDEAEGEADE